MITARSGHGLRARRHLPGAMSAESSLSCLWRQRRGLAVALVVVVIVGLSCLNGKPTSATTSSGTKLLSWTSKDTLVMYVFSNTDSEYINNLRFFVQFAVAEDDNCDYVIIIQTDKNVPVRVCCRLLWIMSASATWTFLFSCMRHHPTHHMSRRLSCPNYQRMPATFTTKMTAMIGELLAGQLMNMA